jgi:hypothetical protein
VASLCKKVISGRPYWYLRELGRVDGKPNWCRSGIWAPPRKIESLLEVREAAVLPERTRHLD